MSDLSYYFNKRTGSFRKKRFRIKTVYINIALFILTFLSCMYAGTFWLKVELNHISDLLQGLTYAILIMSFLSAHEFGHYFAAKYHKVDVTLPFYIPVVFGFGTFGAVIKTRSPVPNSRALFDIGVAGPLAGFVVCLGFLIYGLTTLPGVEYIYQINYKDLEYYVNGFPQQGLFFGDNILYSLMAPVFANSDGFLPPMNEIYHYPFLCVGWFGLFVTSLNMIPVGQLDGGHVTYAMFGKMQSKIARVAWWIMLPLGISGMLGIIYNFFVPIYDDTLFMIFRSILFPPLEYFRSIFPWIYNGWTGWLFWCFITKVFIKLDHPPVEAHEPLDSKRKALGWAALIILILSFSYNGIYIIE